MDFEGLASLEQLSSRNCYCRRWTSGWLENQRGFPCLLSKSNGLVVGDENLTWFSNASAGGNPNRLACRSDPLLIPVTLPFYNLRSTRTSIRPFSDTWNTTYLVFPVPLSFQPFFDALSCEILWRPQVPQKEQNPLNAPEPFEAEISWMCCLIYRGLVKHSVPILGMRPNLNSEYASPKDHVYCITFISIYLVPMASFS